MRKRQLSMEALEKRLVLSGVGQPAADQTGADWQSVIVSFKDDVANPAAAATALMQSAGGHVGHVYQHALKGFSATLPVAAVEGLSHNPLVKAIETNQVVQAYGWPSGTPYVVPHGVDRIDADLSAAQSDWSDVDVAIIDTGIDPDHPDLNVSETGVHFFTRFTGPPNKRIGTDDNFADDAGHGSHVAGIVGALDNDFGVVGVAPGATLWGVKVLDSGGYGTVADIAKGIDWVVTHNRDNDNDIEVINMSLGLQGTSSVLRTAVQSAVDAGIVVVVAAGNDGQDIYGPDGIFDTADDFIPAAYPEAMTISAMVETDGIPGGFGPGTLDGPDDSFAAFSNYSSSSAIDLVLPGVNLWSAWYDGSYVQLSGTSMAAPHAAGLAARYVAENGPATDALGVAAVRQALIANAIAQDDSSGLGLVALNDPDGNLEPIGWAGPLDLGADYLPAADVTGPVAGATVSGVVELKAVVFNDDGAVDHVTFAAANWTDGSAPQVFAATFSETDGTWSISWDTTDLTDGLYKITATATEGTVGANQSGTSSPIFVTVENGGVSDAPPTVAVTYPGDGSTVSGSVDVTASASDDNGVTQVEFFVNGKSIGVDESSVGGWSVAWDTASVPDGANTMTATATDTIGQTASDNVSFTVDNVQGADTIHVADLDGIAVPGKRGKWQAVVSVLIVDASGPVSGAMVFGAWSGAAVGTASGLTGSDGVVTFTSRSNLTGESIAFSVTDVVLEGYEYDATLNAETDITIASPYALSAGMAADLDALAGYLASLSANKQQSGKKNADDQTEVVDLLMAYGL